MSIMAKFARLDSALQRGLDNGFALVFGGKVVPAEIEELLKQEAEDNLVVEDGVVYAPNIYMVGVSSKDLENLSQGANDLAAGFADQLTRWCRNRAWSTHGPMVVRIAEESGLHTGQLRVSSYRDAEPSESSGFEAITTDHVNNQEKSMNQQDVPTELTEMPQDPVVTLLLQDGSSRTFMVNEGSNIIGRSNDADFRLPDTGVSRQHAEITWDGQDAVLVDLQSTNGTTVNDTPVENWLLADGDVITVGHSHIEVRIVDPMKTAGR
ncbi:MAG: DUF3662 and FHA domain-containing protein [Corynebacterium sp.]|uniref:DUF3662 and FHA domain-containing protein n=1 Tax=Corynebacterium sp. TaxID=1720 RepID=UPI0026E0BA69|nr:DUF3662 and FHA domain-containing protein [Corynebacterium sp.]MDO5669928.1 DUF3662 and FHA domain-containing protein [Corynebacterium sp.]